MYQIYDTAVCLSQNASCKLQDGTSVLENVKPLPKNYELKLKLPHLKLFMEQKQFPCDLCNENAHISELSCHPRERNIFQAHVKEQMTHDPHAANN